MPVSEHSVRAIRDLPSLLQFLERDLQWKLPPNPTLEEATFEWSASELRLNEAAQRKLAGGSVLQLRPMTLDQPWGIFIINFTDGQVYKTALRQVLRGLVPKRRRDSSLPAWKHENLLFICTTKNQEFTFAHFRGEKPERAKLIRFSWSPDEPIRTLCEFNLPSLRMPDDPSNPQRWVEEWSKAFDVEKVTEQFFKQYRTIFDHLQKLLFKQSKDKQWAHDYALQFLNRLMFLYFIQKKRWLGNNPRFVKLLWDSYKTQAKQKDTFFTEWLSVLFFEAFNERYQNRAEYQKLFPEEIRSAFASAPFLNGGLFAENALDAAHSVAIPDSFFIELFDTFEGDSPGFFERYNFTIAEDTPLDQEVAVDPEMIGKVYESLVNITFEGITEEDLRGKAGIFYTPRVEIDLMCRLSLTDWLSNQLGQQHKNLLRRAVFAYSPEEKREADEALLKENLWEQLNSALRSITVLDPACGSGSFLIGMLLVLDDLQARANAVLGVQETHYERRKRIIGQSLYGVDVMEWAVHVAELRLWLQLVIETELAPAELKFRPLLPNLSFKVRRGDSLVQEVGGISFGLHREHLEISPALKGKLTALKGEKLKFFQGEYRQTEKKRAEIEQEEFRIFSEILNEKKTLLQKEITKLTRRIEQPEGEQIELMDTSRSTRLVDLQRLETQKAELTHELSHINDALTALRESKQVPFVWDIAFVEIFESEREGFDIVIGNPPYVRQEMIADPTLDPADFGGENSERWKKKKAEYKAKLQRSVYEAYPKHFGYNRFKGTVAKKIDGKCDLYIFFYLHGLSLLNPKGSFCFITSNSWLDVGYGADLQEFLLKYCAIKYIIDNEAKRSFAQADVNTVICLFGAPVGQVENLSHNARFIMFRVPFEYALSPVVFEEIDEATERLRRPEFRVVAKKHEELFAEGLEVSDDEEVHIEMRDRKYAGDKWGGKYLRAPESFWKLLQSSKVNMVQLDELIEYDYGLKPGAVDFFYLDSARIEEFKIESEFLRPIITSSRDISSYVAQANRYIFWCSAPTESIRNTGAGRYIEWGVSRGFNKLPSVASHRPFWYTVSDDPADCVLLQFWDKRFWTPRIEGVSLVSNNFYRGRLKKNRPKTVLALLNSIFFFLQIEIFGRTNQGQGVLNTYGPDFKAVRLPDVTAMTEDAHKDIMDAYEELSRFKVLPIERDIQRPERLKLDSLVLRALGLNEDLLLELYHDMVKLVATRLEKANSLPRRRKKK